MGEFYKELILTFKETEKTGNRLIYKNSFNSLKAFNKGHLNILFSDIDVQWLNKYERCLRAKGNKDTTISLLFRTLRSAYNKAVEMKCAKKTNYPFHDFKVSRFDVKTKKRAISKEDVLKIMKLDLAGEKRSLQFARDASGNINLWKLFNLFTGANKMSYIDTCTAGSAGQPSAPALGTLLLRGYGPARPVAAHAVEWLFSCVAIGLLCAYSWHRYA